MRPGEEGAPETDSSPRCMRLWRGRALRNEAAKGLETFSWPRLPRERSDVS